MAWLRQRVVALPRYRSMYRLVAMRLWSDLSIVLPLLFRIPRTGRCLVLASQFLVHAYDATRGAREAVSEAVNAEAVGDTN